MALKFDRTLGNNFPSINNAGIGAPCKGKTGWTGLLYFAKRNENLYFVKWKSVTLFDSLYSVYEMPKYSENSDGVRKFGVFVAATFRDDVKLLDEARRRAH